MNKNFSLGAMQDSIPHFDSYSEAEMASSYPGAPQNKGGIVTQKYEYKVKYGKFFIQEGGNPELEAIMEDIALGKKLLSWERVTDTKDGETFVTIKYIIPVAKHPKGQRRIRKALGLFKE